MKKITPIGRLYTCATITMTIPSMLWVVRVSVRITPKMIVFMPVLLLNDMNTPSFSMNHLIKINVMYITLPHTVPLDHWWPVLEHPYLLPNDPQFLQWYKQERAVIMEYHDLIRKTARKTGWSCPGVWISGYNMLPRTPLAHGEIDSDAAFKAHTDFFIACTKTRAITRSLLDHWCNKHIAAQQTC